MRKAFKEITKCRICGNKNLITILSLGCQALTGVFPKHRDQHVTSGPLDMVKCDESAGKECCGLLQLKQSYDPDEMYGHGYGYHSSLNPSMVDHLNSKVRRLLPIFDLSPRDLVLDIGSNDATLLKAYPPDGATLVGVDPAGPQFKKYYPPLIHLISDFFSVQAVRKRFGGRKAKIITSIAMFYDLEAPMDFVRQVGELLADDGVWVLEQGYMPAMLETNAYDAVCHEHLEYYGLQQIRWMTERAGLRIVDVEINKINGGSFSVMVAKAGSPLKSRRAAVEALLRREKNLSSLRPFLAFREKTLGHREDLVAFFERAHARGKRILGYGASTKGNVILQFCGFTPADIPRIGEVNAGKFGCLTPGTHIPIVPERDVKAERPDYLLVLPWHFRDFILKKEAAYRDAGGRFLFPLPKLEVV